MRQMTKLIALAAAFNLVGAPTLAATFYSQEPGFVSRGEIQSIFGLTAKETDDALATINSAVLMQDVTYIVTCEWTSADGTIAEKSLDRHFIYKVGILVVPRQNGSDKYSGLTIIPSGTGYFEVIQDADLPLINARCPADAGMMTNDPAELDAVVKTVEEPFGTRTSEVSLTYRDVTRTLHTVAPEYNRPY